MLTIEELYRLNEALTEILAELGWVAEDEDSRTKVDNAVHYIVEMFFSVSSRKRLEELRIILRAENMSYEELAELQSLAQCIDPSDVELLEAAGVPEFPDDEE